MSRVTTTVVKERAETTSAAGSANFSQHRLEALLAFHAAHNITAAAVRMSRARHDQDDQEMVTMLVRTTGYLAEREHPEPAR